MEGTRSTGVWWAFPAPFLGLRRLRRVVVASEHCYSWRIEALNPPRKLRWRSGWTLVNPLSVFLAAPRLPTCFSHVLTLVASSASPVPSHPFLSHLKGGTTAYTASLAEIVPVCGWVAF